MSWVFDTPYPYRRREEAHYDVQQVCLKGHQITASYNRSPQHRQEHCDKCGAPTIYKCPKCNEDIKGHYFSPGAVSGLPTPVPEHCHKCGSPYPWTELKAVSGMVTIIHAERLGLELPPIFEKLGLSENWRVASSALASFEVMVNRKLERMKLPTTGTYDERVSRLATALKRQGIPFDELMISSFRTARAKVLHDGKEPTESELTDIIKYLKTATHTLFPD